MASAQNSIIRFDDDGNLNLFGHNEVLTQAFRSSAELSSFRAALSDFGTFSKCCPEMVTILNEMLPRMPEYVADLPSATRRLMQEGKLFLRPDKDGNLLATLVNSDSQRIDSIVRLKEVQQIPSVNDMIFSLSFMAITRQLNEIQEGIEGLRQGQIHDRETSGTVAAQYLQWAATESDPTQRSKLCSKAHDNAVEGFFACRNTVEESASFFLDQPSATSLGGGMLQQLAPWNWVKTVSTAVQMHPKAEDLQRSIAKCTYCAQYASAASFMVGDRSQATRDLDMYAEHMSRTLLGEKAAHLKPWLSPKTLEALPLSRGAVPAKTQDGMDVLSYVEKTVSRIKALPETPGSRPDSLPQATKATENLTEE